MYRPIERYKTKSGIRSLPHLLLRLLQLVLICFFTYSIVTVFFIRAYTIDSISMKPTLDVNEKVLASVLSYGYQIPWNGKRIGFNKNPVRGDIVIISSPYAERSNFILIVANGIVDFFTLHRVSLIKDRGGNDINRFMIKRVIGLPGDIVKLRNYRCFIKPPSSDTFKDESEIIKVSYAINTKIRIDGNGDKYPFSGNMGPVELGKNEYFVLGDNRPFSSDSRSWGKINYKHILAKVVLKYWPADKLQSY